MFSINRQSALVVFACLWATVAMGQATRPATRPATETAPADSVAVTINGHAVMESDVKRMFQAEMELRGRKMAEAQAERMLTSFRPQVMDSVISKWLLDKQVEQAKLDVTDEELTETLERALKVHLMLQGITREAFAEQFKVRAGMSLEEFLVKRVANPANKQSALQRKLLEKKFPDKVTVTEEEIKERYQQRMNQAYNQARASHILIDTRQLKTDEAKNEAREKIDQILIEAKKPGADFAALAREHSDCSSKSKGGDLGLFPREGVMAEPFSEAAFALKPGEISDVVETQFGYHIIKVAEFRTITLEEARESIIEELKARKLHPVRNQYIAELKQSATIVYPPGKEPKPARQPTRRAGKVSTQPATGPASATRPAGDTK